MKIKPIAKPKKKDNLDKCMECNKEIEDSDSCHNICDSCRRQL